MSNYLYFFERENRKKGYSRVILEVNSEVGLGPVGALLMIRLIKMLVFSVSVSDPSTFVGVSVLLYGVVMLACFLPAREATQVYSLVAQRRG